MNVHPVHAQAPAPAPPASLRGAAGEAAAVAAPAAEGAPRRQWDDDGAGDGPRPQDAFRVPVDNADAPFRPRADHWPGFQARAEVRGLGTGVRDVGIQMLLFLGHPLLGSRGI